MRVLVTGATGLIGCHSVAALLEAGHDVRAIARDPAKVERVMDPLLPAGGAASLEAVRADLVDRASIEAALVGCDAVVHAAGVFSHSLADAELLEATNVGGTRTVLEAAAKAGLDPIVHVSSMVALFPPQGDRIRADDPVRDPKAMYSATKARADRIAREFQESGAPVVILYPGSVQGPHDPTVGSGPGVLRDQLRAGRILVTQGGLATVDVRDVAELVARLIEPGRGPRRLVTTAEFLRHDELHRILCELTGRDLAAQKIPGAVLRSMGRAGDWVQKLRGREVQLTHEAALILTRSVPFDDAEARSLLGRDPIPMEQSLRDVLVWMAEAGVLKERHVGRLAATGS